MDSLITAAALALAAGDPLGALKRVALREDPPALALRGIAMARLGDFERAKALIRRAARGFGSREPVARARCIVAEAEIALVSRDLGWTAKALGGARATLEARGDHVNAAHAAHLEVRQLLLMGQLDAAERMLAAVDKARLPPLLQGAHELVAAAIAVRRIRTGPARAALSRAQAIARAADIAVLAAEAEKAALALEAPAARIVSDRGERVLVLAEVEALLGSETLVVDACRYAVRDGVGSVPLASRPVLFALARALAEAWPGEVSREVLIRRAFGGKEADESHRARLRVEVGRLRKALAGMADLTATARGFQMAPRRAGAVAVLAPPVEGDHARVLALLADGEAWSSSALALALGAGQRSVQRALEALAAAGSVQPIGKGRARRWSTPLPPGFTTTLLLPGPLQGG